MENYICVFQDDGEIILGQAKSLNSNKISLVTDSDQELKIAASRVYKIKSDGDIKLKEIKERAFGLANQVDIVKAWKRQKKEQNISAQEVAKDFLGEVNTETHLAAFLKLISDNTYFKRNKDEFTARSQKEVTKRKEYFAKKQKTELEIKQTLEYLEAGNSLKQEMPEYAEKLILNLELLAAESKDLVPEDRKDCLSFLKKLMDFLKIENLGGVEKNAYQTLKKLDLIDENSHFIFVKHSIRNQFSKQALQEVKQIKRDYQKIIEENHKRKDLSNLNAITIDDQHTMDMDDALSIERNGDSYQLGIHISDIAALIPIGSALDKVAIQNATSTYCPEEIFNMFPEEIAYELGSLVENELRPAMSVIINTDQEYKIKDYKIISSLIKVKQKLSYDQANLLLDQDDYDMLDYYQIASQHETERVLNGAIKSPKQSPEVRVRDGQLSFGIIDESDFSRDIIAELMVLVNKCFSEYAAKYFLPAFFRCQDASDANDHFQPSYSSLTAKRHHSLGLDTYLQASSPIRRYHDLCNQRQISNHLLNKKAIYERKDLSKVAKLTAHPLRNSDQVAKEAKRFWLLKYLEQNFMGVTLDATVLRNDKKKAKVRLNDCLITGLVNVPDNTETGSIIQVKVVSVEPQHNNLKLEMV